MADVNTEPVSKKKLAYIRRERTKEMRYQLVSFGLMIFMTFIAFGLASMDFAAEYVMPIVMLFAFMQVILQFYYFMHVKDKGHGFVKLFMIVGFYFAIAFCVTFIYIVWIGQPLGTI